MHTMVTKILYSSASVSPLNRILKLIVAQQSSSGMVPLAIIVKPYITMMHKSHSSQCPTATPHLSLTLQLRFQ